MPWENNKYQKRLSSQDIPWDYQRKPSDSLGEFADKEYGKKSSSGKVNKWCIMVWADKAVGIQGKMEWKGICQNRYLLCQ